MTRHPAINHETCSQTCFDMAWELLKHPSRSDDEDLGMIHTAHAALHHWSQRPDVTAENYAVGYWLLARVYAVLGQAAPSITYGEQALRYSQSLPPFYQAYAHEALARAYALTQDRKRLRAHMTLAREFVNQLNQTDRQQLLDDLASIGQ